MICAHIIKHLKDLYLNEMTNFYIDPPKWEFTIILTKDGTKIDCAKISTLIIGDFEVLKINQIMPHNLASCVNKNTRFTSSDTHQAVQGHVQKYTFEN